MSEVLAYWHGGTCAIRIDHTGLRGPVVTILYDGYSQDKRTVHRDADGPYITHRNERLRFCETERKRMGI